MRSIITFFLLFSFIFALGSQVENSKQPEMVKENTNILDRMEKTYKSKSILSTGKWIRLSTDKTGILKLTNAKLAGFGITDPENVAVYTNGGYMLPNSTVSDYPDDLTQIPVLHGKDKNGESCIFFYCGGTTKWNFDNKSKRFVQKINLYTDSTFFYLSSDVPASPAPQASEIYTSTPDTLLKSYIALSFYEKENINIFKSGKRFFSDLLMDQIKKTYSFSCPNAISSREAKVTIASASRCISSSTSIGVKMNNASEFSINFDRNYTTTTAYEDESTWSVASKENMIIDLTYKGSGGEGWLDYITLNVPTNLNFTGNQLDFRSDDALRFNWIKYSVSTSNSNCIVWNVDNNLSPQRVTTSFNADSKELSFIWKGGSINNFITFDPINGSFSEPQFSSSIKNQNLHGLSSYDMIIVTHPNFINESNNLAEYHHQFDNLNVLVVTINEVYNEFSSGLPDPSAIRNMFCMFYAKGKNSATPFKYALLMGDGNYNNRAMDKNFIPTYQSDLSLAEEGPYVTDDFYGWLDTNKGDSLFLGVGRIPCKTTMEAGNVINKIISYNKPETLGDWRNVVCFLADDQDVDDGPQFMRNSEELIDTLNKNYPGFLTKKIYFDSYQQITTSGGEFYPDVTTAINESVNDGALIVNYIGHGNPTSMAHENVLLINDINAWSNSKNLPLFVTATCEFGRFDGDAVSSAEAILLNPTGGGIGLFTTTRQVYATYNQELSRDFYSNIFVIDSQSKEKLRLGDVMRNAKNKNYDDNKYSFVLLADPALRLSFPKYKVRTTSINNENANSEKQDTIGALEKVTIKGEVTTSKGDIIKDFNGTLATVIYDKETIVETLGNDAWKPYSYPVQNNIIYKGVSSVTNGEFELSFIVPKDISYNIGSGRIVYYTSNGIEDGNGAYSSFLIGGSAKNPIIDNNPPEIDMYINNKDFKPYGNVSSSSLLLIDLFDESGINTVGTGIGHDLIAVLDDDYSNPIVLNDYYTSVTDNYQKGKISYLLSDLKPGTHKIWIRVWDVQNNSAQKEIYFVVEDGFKITSTYNIPNPVSSTTDFIIEHNLPGDVFNVTINIYTLDGLKVNTIKEKVSSSKSSTLKIGWNVFQSAIPIIQNQWLFYQVILENQKKLKATGAGKMLISVKN